MNPDKLMDTMNDDIAETRPQAYARGRRHLLKRVFEFSILSLVIGTFIGMYLGVRAPRNKHEAITLSESTSTNATNKYLRQQNELLNNQLLYEKATNLDCIRAYQLKK